MSKRLQKLASVLLAMMMVGAVVPGFSMAEDVAANVTTPSDLPGATEKPTEVPTEEPTEEPTQEPTEVPTEEPTEEPPVFVVEEEELPMLMAAAETAEDLATYGITPGEGAVYNVTDDSITLESGSYSGSVNASGKNVVIESGATLKITSGSNFNRMTVHGSLTIDGQNINVNGAVTVAGGSLSSTGRWNGSNVISQLTIISTSGVNTQYTHINVLNLPESWLKDIALSFAEADLDLYPDATPPTANSPASTWITISYADINLDAFKKSEERFFEYKPVDPDQVVGSGPVQYKVIFHNGGSNPEFTIMIPVKEKTKVHVRGSLEKVYDGTGDFSGKMLNAKWVDEKGNVYPELNDIEFTVSGTYDGGVLRYSAWDVPCNVTILSHNLPAGFIFEQTAKVDIRVISRQLTLTPRSLEIYEGETPAFEVRTNTGVDMGLAPNHTVEVTYIIQERNGKEWTDATLPVGIYLIAIKDMSENIKDASGNDVDSWLYDVRYEKSTLTVKEPAYTVTIPAAVELNGGAGNMAIDCEIHGKINVDVTATSANGWKLTDGSQSLDYTLTPEASATRAATGDALASFTESGTANLVFATNPNPFPGTYEDTLTFTVTK